VILQLLQRDKLKFSWMAFPVYRTVHDGGCNQGARHLNIVGSAKSVRHARRHRIRDLKKLVKQLVVEMKKTYNALRHNDSSRGGFARSLGDQWAGVRNSTEAGTSVGRRLLPTPAKGIEAQMDRCGHQGYP
jgi:hypothetical protein